MGRVVAYARDSGGRDQQLSVDQQLERIGAWCKERGFILARTFADRARSGTTLAGRDEFRAMMDYLDTVPESGVVLWEYSRLARDFDDSVWYIADLRRRGIEVYSLNDAIPPGLDGRLLESIVAWKNAKYSEDLARNVSRGLRYLVSHHKGHAGRPPIGYMGESVQVGTRRDGSPHVITRLIPDLDKAPLVRQAFEMRAGGSTLGEIHAAVRLFDWLVVYGKMLINPIYKGVYRYGGHDYADFCEPLVDAATWEAVQLVNRERRERHGYNHPRAVRSRFFLTGLLSCARCGRTMHGRTTHQRKPYQGVYDYYICSSHNGASCGALSIPKGELEARVMDVVTSIILTPRVMGDLQDEIQRQQSQAGSAQASARARLEREESDVTNHIGRIVAAIRDAGHSAALIGELELLERRQAELSELLIQSETIPTPVIQPIDLDLVRLALSVATEIEKGIILRGFVKSIRVEKVDGTITGAMQVGIGEAVEYVDL